MSVSLDEVRRWAPTILRHAYATVGSRQAVAERSRGELAAGAEVLAEGWSGKSADAVLEAVERERSHISRLHDGLEDLADTVRRAEEALIPAVQLVRDRIGAAEADGLEVVADTVRASAAAGDVPAELLDEHSEGIGEAVATVRSLDDHYGGEIDAVAALLYRAIPAEADRSPIPGPDDPWPGHVLDAMTGAMSDGLPYLADDVDPRTRGRHLEDPLPEDLGRKLGTGLRGLGKFAGPAGTGLTVYDGIEGYARGETTAGEATAETLGALGGGMGGGALAGAIAGAAVGPLGAIVGAGIGAAVGSALGKKAMDEIYEAVTGDDG